jgi:serine/threonine protein kinase
METGSFLRLAIQIVAALGKVHQRGLMHKDIKPANFLVNRTNGSVRLTGFGFASRRPRERQPPATPESIAGTVTYMAPEQTGRMNRSMLPENREQSGDVIAVATTNARMSKKEEASEAGDEIFAIEGHLLLSDKPAKLRHH